MHHAPFWVALSADRRDGCSASRVAVWFYIVDPTTAARGSPSSNDWLYRFLLNKWYFDELYDFLFVRPAMWLGRFLWKKGDGWLIDGFGPDGVSARVLDVTQQRGPAADRLPLPLRLRDADRRRGARHLADVRGMRSPMTTGRSSRPSPSCRSSARCSSSSSAATTRSRGATSSTSRSWTTLVTFVLSLFIWSSFDPPNPGFQFVEERRLDRRLASPTAWASTASRCCSSS